MCVCVCVCVCVTHVHIYICTYTRTHTVMSYTTTKQILKTYLRSKYVSGGSSI